ncbi:MAG TPA: acyl-CoA dehydratase activase [Spirochaetota bacterium]|nr:acyl-CoA dehydratase activase [Spirochaetota bacterium]HPI90453.1 acyl-CoA dehydratase activase [Spirochaetota bacterium]HPR49362.1 acyl-CoA dehydratase activase [Spirochaetota bacterium]
MFAKRAIAAGMDIGTRFVKICIAEGANILATEMSAIDRDFDRVIAETFNAALKAAALKEKQVAARVATGFGADLVRADRIMSEPRCLARAAAEIAPGTRTIVDVGALFINGVTIDENGRMEDSVKNDTCASGSGKFLEMISDALDIPLSEISETAARSSSPYSLASTCAVFAESEIITQVNSGRPGEDLIAGILNSIAAKTATLAGRLNASGTLSVTGGVAAFAVFPGILQSVTGMTVRPLPLDPFFCAAYGAALYGAR